MMVIYDGCPITGGTQITGGCNDDACGASGTNSRVSIAAGGLTANKTYWIRISGWSGNFGNFPFKVVNLACQFNSAVVCSPAYGATGVGSPVTLVWHGPDSGATHYDVLLDTVNPPVTVVATDLVAVADTNECNAANPNSFNLGVLAPNTTYYVRVNGKNNTTTYQSAGYISTFTTAP
jgi:hypothetical protein